MQLKKIIIIYLISIVVINLLVFAFFEGINPFSESEKSMIILKIKPLNYAMVFAHGRYASYCYPNDLNCTYWINRHTTVLNSTDSINTINLLNDLKKEGFERVWLSQCHTGDYPYMTFNSSSGERIEWYDWVSRNERPGAPYLVFLGFGFIRISL